MLDLVKHCLGHQFHMKIVSQKVSVQRGDGGGGAHLTPTTFSTASTAYTEFKYCFRFVIHNSKCNHLGILHTPNGLKNFCKKKEKNMEIQHTSSYRSDWQKIRNLPKTLQWVRDVVMARSIIFELITGVAKRDKDNKKA